MDTNTQTTPEVTTPQFRELPPPDPLFALNQAQARVMELETDLANTKRELGDAVAHIQRLNENPFLKCLSTLASGDAMIDAGEELNSLSTQVGKLNEKGSFTLKLALKPLKGAIQISYEIKTTPPKRENEASLFYVREDGSLSRNDPRQKEFGFGSREDRALAAERRNPEYR
jgi:hypothetical protein